MPLRVLIVDDEPTLRSNLAAYLDDEGIEALTASSGEEALKVLEAHPEVDACVMDMRLPGIDGNETIREIHRRFPKVVCVVHTGSAAYSLPDDLRAQGMTSDRVLRKPLADMAVLSDLVRRLTERDAHE